MAEEIRTKPPQLRVVPPQLLRRLGTRDAALIVMGGIVGSGIFMNPSVVARSVASAPLIMLVWVAGGAIALLGGGIFAELAARRPHDGGLYAYMRDAFHPALAFTYGWTLLLVSQSGGMAAAAVTFSNYFEPLTGLHVSVKMLGIVAIALFTLVNALGVRTGASTQNAFMILKIVAIAAFVAVGLLGPQAPPVAAVPSMVTPAATLAAMGLAMVPVLFAYSGWQTASFMSAELKNPAITLPRGMVIGVLCVVTLYLAVNAVCLRVLGPQGLAATNTPASAIAQLALGPIGARVMAVVVALSTLGFLANQILTSPRVYFQMAADKTFFPQLAWIDPRTHAPVVAIVLQGLVAAVIAFSGRYDQILNYVTSVDYAFFGLSAIALIVFRNRDARDPSAAQPYFRMPGHPWTTVLFLVAAWSIVGDVLIKSPLATSIGLGILLTGLPAYVVFAARNRRRQAEAV
ncbi:MAG: amino acid permease [Candidatus Eremiobacteraeota bacterium]|nr:amino acid permease [Candidatus Eremiobacteraeota bacterium]